MNVIWMLQITRWVDGWNGDYEEQDVSIEDGWYSTEEAALRECGTRNSKVAQQYADYCTVIDNSNKRARHRYDEKCLDHQALTQAGRPSKQPVEPAYEKPESFDDWSHRNYAYHYAPVAVEEGAHQP